MTPAQCRAVFSVIGRTPARQWVVHASMPPLHATCEHVDDGADHGRTLHDGHAARFAPAQLFDHVRGRVDYVTVLVGHVADQQRQVLCDHIRVLVIAPKCLGGLL